MDRKAIASMQAPARMGLITSLHARMVAMKAELIEVIAVSAAEGDYLLDGATSMAEWLVAAQRLPYRTAAEWVGLATELESLPALSSAFAEGAIPFESVQVAAKLADADSDAFIAFEAQECPASDLAAALRRKEAIAAESDRMSRRPEFRYWFDKDGWCRVSGFLAPEDGATLITSLERAARLDDEPDPLTGAYEPAETLAARGLVTIASSALAADSDPDRATVVVHVALEDFLTGKGTAELASGGVICAEVARRMGCDGRLEFVVEGDQGAVGIGRASRVTPSWLRRRLVDRDRCCRFPGCGRRHHLHAHHIVWWTNGGTTDVTNLALLCTRHHALMHEGGWSITGNPEPGPGRGTLNFLRPDGSPFEPGVPAGERSSAATAGTAGGSPPGAKSGSRPPEGRAPDGRTPDGDGPGWRPRTGGPPDDDRLGQPDTLSLWTLSDA